MDHDEAPVTIGLHDEYVTVTIREGKSVTRKIVSSKSLIEIFSAEAIGTSMLPQNTIHWGRSGGKDRYFVWHPAAIRDVIFPDKTYKVPMPSFIFAGCGRHFWIFALKSEGYPSMSDKVFYPPLHNIYGGGRICSGENVFEEAAPLTMEYVWESVWASMFTGHIIAARCQSGSLPMLLGKVEASGASGFPLDELVEFKRHGLHMSVADLITTELK